MSKNTFVIVGSLWCCFCCLFLVETTGITATTTNNNDGNTVINFARRHCHHNYCKEFVTLKKWNFPSSGSTSTTTLTTKQSSPTISLPEALRVSTRNSNSYRNTTNTTTKKMIGIASVSYKSRLRRRRRQQEKNLNDTTTQHGSEESIVKQKQPNTMDRAAIKRTSRSIGLTMPFIKTSIWDKLDGTEWGNPVSTATSSESDLQQQQQLLLHRFVIMCENVAGNEDGDEWIQWKEKQTTGTIQDGQTIHVWTGKASKRLLGNDKKGTKYMGEALPFIKTRSIVPISVHDMVDLVMDSSKVKIYSPMSLGRRDVVHFNDTVPTSVRIGSEGSGTPKSPITKIVQNVIQPPIGKKKMISTTFIHAQPIPGGSGDDWIVVSRSIGDTDRYSSSMKDDGGSYGQNHVLLGINVFERIDETSCKFTAVTHMYSKAMPVILSERIGVKSAVQFMKDIRKLKHNGSI